MDRTSCTFEGGGEVGPLGIGQHGIGNHGQFIGEVFDVLPQMPPRTGQTLLGHQASLGEGIEGRLPWLGVPPPAQEEHFIGVAALGPHELQCFGSRHSFGGQNRDVHVAAVLSERRAQLPQARHRILG